MTYGTASGVAAYTPRYTNASGVFDGDTRPTAAQVSDWLDQVTAIIDYAADHAQVDTGSSSITPMLDAFAEAQVAELVLGVNGAGRYGPTEGRGSTLGSWFAVVTKDAAAFMAEAGKEPDHVGVTMFTRQDAFSD